MFGYVRANSCFMDEQDKTAYKGYYCGICKSMKRRYGIHTTLTLSYEAAFLSLILDSINGNSPTRSEGRCHAHMLKPRLFLSGASADYAADINVILAYKSLEDNIVDESPLWRIPAALLKPAFSSALKNITNAENVLSDLNGLSIEERSGHCTTDSAAHFSGRLIGGILSAQIHDKTAASALYDMGYQLGRWIYIIDAFDDLLQDLKKKRFNPLVSDFKIKKESFYSDVERMQLIVEDSLFLTLEHIRAGWESAKAHINGRIISNIILLGLKKVTSDTISKYRQEETHDERSL